MIAQRLFELRERVGHRGALRWREEAWTYGQLADAIERLSGPLGPFHGRRVGVAVADVPRQLVTLAALDAVGAVAVLYAASTHADVLAQSRRELQLCEMLCDLPGLDEPLSRYLAASGGEVTKPDSAGEGRLVLFTSGTSGRPKPAVHTWRSLAAAVRQEDRFADRCWMLTYEPSKFAALQVILQALLTGGRLAVPEELTPQAAACCLVEQQVEFASGTPTFWRMLLQTGRREQLCAAPLEQITLGGEAVDQPLLDALRAVFPKARISHVYASTEMGTCFSVTDGKAGFPRDYLQDASLPCRLRIAEDGELLIQSRRAMAGYLDTEAADADWFPSGDLVQERADRVVFIGRKSDAINVGGSKVHPLEVEQVIRAVDGVREVRVYGLSSSLVGQLVAADVQPDPDINRQDLHGRILETCRQQLAKYKVPARIQWLDLPPAAASGKLSRLSE